MKIQMTTVLVGVGLLFGGASKSYAFQMQERESIAAAAHDVDEKANHLIQWAEARAGRRWHLEEAALDKLHVFADRAHEFHERVESWRGDDQKLRRNFDKLLDAWYRVEDTFTYLHADDHVTNDYLRTRDAIYRLQALAQNTRTLNPYRGGQWWQEIWHVHGPDCGHYYWGGQWHETPPGDYYEHGQYDPYHRNSEHTYAY